MLLLSCLSLFLPAINCHYMPPTDPSEYYSDAEGGSFSDYFRCVHATHKAVSIPLAPGESIKTIHTSPKRDCMEVIVSTTEGATLSFVFAQFKSVNGKSGGHSNSKINDCNGTGFVEFRDGRNSQAKLIARYCRLEQMLDGFPVISSTGNQLYYFSNITKSGGYYKGKVIAGIKPINAGTNGRSNHDKEIGSIPEEKEEENADEYHKEVEEVDVEHKEEEEEEEEEKDEDKDDDDDDDLSEYEDNDEHDDEHDNNDDDDSIFFSDTEYEYYLDDGTVISKSDLKRALDSGAKLNMAKSPKKRKKKNTKEANPEGLPQVAVSL